jgi:hypothetical protein
MDMQTKRRALLGAMALAPIATAAIAVPAIIPQGSGAFDAALATYYRLRDADRHDAKYGALKASYDTFKRQTAPLAAKYGEARFATGEDAAVFHRHWAEQEAAENRHIVAFSEPRWDAFEALLAVPAPSAAALLLKIELMPEEGFEEERWLDQVRADLRHLAGGLN